MPARWPIPPGYSPDLNFGQKLQLLETFDVVERLKLALQFQRERLAELQVRKRIRDDVEDGAQKQQREYFLRRQMDAIRKELGENDGSIADEYRAEDFERRHARTRCGSRPNASWTASSGWETRTPSRR